MRACPTGVSLLVSTAVTEVLRDGLVNAAKRIPLNFCQEAPSHSFRSRLFVVSGLSHYICERPAVPVALHCYTAGSTG
jgi:hypothetical protein